MPAPIKDVVNIQVVVTNQTNGHVRTLTYPAHNTMIDMVTVNTLSVDFTSSDTGNIKFDVDALNNLGCSMGHGTVTHRDREGERHRRDGLPAGPADLPQPRRRTPDGGGSEGGVVLPRLRRREPAKHRSQCHRVRRHPDLPGVRLLDGPAARNVCVPGGTGGPGTACATNADCEPGTQCSTT
jgi:hypothetical protein